MSRSWVLNNIFDIIGNGWTFIKMFKRLIYILAISIFAACAPSRFVKPLNKGERALNASLGGPLIGFANTTIPIPFTTIVYGYGLKQNFTLFGSIHTTSLLFGVFQTDVGCVTSLYKNDSMGIGFTASPIINFAIDKWDGNKKVWPQLDINFYKEFKKNRFYIGMANWFELSSTKAHAETQQTHWLLNPHVGYSFCQPKWIFNLELKILAPTIDRLPNVVDYKGFGNKGATGIYFSVTRKF